MESSYITFSMSEINSIVFTEIEETLPSTLRLSVDGSKGFVKWNGDTPDFINTLETKSPIYTHDEMLDVLKTQEWLETSPYSPIN